MSRWRAAVWTGDAWLDDATVVVDDRTVVEVRAPEPGDPERMDGLICPGLINAHTHLELSWAGLVPGGGGVPDWVSKVMQLQRPNLVERREAGIQAARWLHARGAVAVCDVSSQGDTAEWIARAGLVGVVHHERLGFDRKDLDERVADARKPDSTTQGPAGSVITRPAPHAPYSTPPQLIRAACRPGQVPASIHLAEDPAELRFLTHGDGRFANILDRLGRDWRWWTPPNADPAAYLDELDVLGPGLMLVHGTWLDEAALARVARRAATICLCPRSNRHITGRLPDVPAMVVAGVPLAIGTDSLASSPDLDVLGEIAVLVKAFPQVDPTTWLRAATVGGAEALGLKLGRIEPGAAGGVLFLEGVSSAADLSELAKRRWLSLPRPASA